MPLPCAFPTAARAPESAAACSAFFSGCPCPCPRGRCACHLAQISAHYRSVFDGADIACASPAVAAAAADAAAATATAAAHAAAPRRSYDRFIRTSEEEHQRNVRAAWEVLSARGATLALAAGAPPPQRRSRVCGAVVR